MRTRRLPLVIAAEDYARLVEVARREERDPLQQARWLLRQALQGAAQSSVSRPFVECFEGERGSGGA